MFWVYILSKPRNKLKRVLSTVIKTNYFLINQFVHKLTQSVIYFISKSYKSNQSCDYSTFETNVCGDNYMLEWNTQIN